MFIYINYDKVDGFIMDLISQLKTAGFGVNEVTASKYIHDCVICETMYTGGKILQDMCDNRNMIVYDMSSYDSHSIIPSFVIYKREALKRKILSVGKQTYQFIDDVYYAIIRTDIIKVCSLDDVKAVLNKYYTRNNGAYFFRGRFEYLN